MAAYATEAQWTAWTAHLVLDNEPENIGLLLERASLDLDAYLGHPNPATAGLRIAVSDLTAYQQDRLARATVAQAAYRVIVEELDMVEGAPRVTSLGSVGLATTAPERWSPEALWLLDGSALLRRSGAATGE